MIVLEFPSENVRICFWSRLSFIISHSVEYEIRKFKAA